MNKKENEKLTLIQKYYDEAKIKLWKQCYVDQNNKIQGESKLWYENGQIGIISNFKDGRWHGKRQQWCRDGRGWYIETRHFKKNGTKHGTKIEFKYGKR